MAKHRRLDSLLMSLSGHAPSSYLIGDGTGKGLEDAEYFAFEACEYKRHFLAYSTGLCNYDKY